MSYAVENNKHSGNFYNAAQTKKHYGRARSVKGITIHWWGDPATDPTFENVVNYLCRKGSTSAHTVIEAGRIEPIVDFANSAWHSGSAVGNATTVGFECNPRASDEDYATIAEYVRDVRAQYGDIPLYPHKHFKNTACPGVYDLARIDALARGTAVSTVVPVAHPVSVPVVSATTADGNLWLAEDGIMGAATISRWQQMMGTPIDGAISRPKSSLIRAVQIHLTNRGVSVGRFGVDGMLGTSTIKGIQRYLGTPVDGVISHPKSTMVKALQIQLNSSRF